MVHILSCSRLQLDVSKTNLCMAHYISGGGAQPITSNLQRSYKFRIVNTKVFYLSLEELYRCGDVTESCPDVLIYGQQF